jgi:hypothetical protein
MAALFRPRANLIARAVLLAILVLAVGLSAGVVIFRDSAYVTRVDLEVDQPVPFSHRHHVGQLGLECAYCHGVRTDTAKMGMPEAQVCMHCHSQVWTESDVLKPVRDAAATGRPIVWARVYKLPDHVFFDHSVHLGAGIACVRCHGDLGEQALAAAAAPMQMKWCLECHRHPDRAGVPEERVENPRSGRAAEITNCSACHR